MSQFLRFGPSKGYKVTIFAEFRIKYTSRRSIFLNLNDTSEPEQPLDVNTLHNVYGVEKIIQLTNRSGGEIIINSYWTEKILLFLSNTPKVAASELNSAYASAP